MSATTAKKTPKKSAKTRRPALTPAAGLDTTGMPSEVAGIGADDPYAATVWANNVGTTTAEDLVCPSGQLALVRRPGLQGLIEAGVLHNVDSLTGLVDEKHIKRVKGGGAQPKIDTKKIMKDPKALSEIMDVVDKVVVHVVVKPPLKLTYTEDEAGDRTPVERKSGVVYVDMVELEDKMFIFNCAVGGTRSLQRFRDEASELVDGMDSEPDDEGEAK